MLRLLLAFALLCFALLCLSFLFFFPPTDFRFSLITNFEDSFSLRHCDVRDIAALPDLIRKEVHKSSSWSITKNNNNNQQSISDIIQRACLQTTCSEQRKAV